MTDALTTLGNPELDTFTMRLPDAGIELTDWIEYTYRQAFLDPCASWSFKFDASALTSSQRTAFYPGQRVVLQINGKTQTSGYFIRVHFANDRNGGSICTLQGHDILEPFVRANVDPSFKFTESQTLADILRVLFAEHHLPVSVLDNDANRNIITGASVGVRTSKKGRVLKTAQIHQCQPYFREGAYAFCARLLARFGLHMWAAADGQSVIVSAPNFDQDPIGRLKRKADDTSDNNIVSGETTYDAANQPAAILAMGCGGGGEFARATVRSAIVNPLVFADLSTVKKRWPQVPFQAYAPAPVGFDPFPVASPTVVFEQDEESHTVEQLQHYLYRRMSEHLRQAVVSSYTIWGHSLGGNVLALDTVLDVDDDRSGPDGLHAPMWVIEREFRKARDAQGSMSTVHLIPLNTMAF